MGKDGYIKEHELSAFTFANPLFWCIIFSFTKLYGLINFYVLYRKGNIDLLVSHFALKQNLLTGKCWPSNRDYMVMCSSVCAVLTRIEYHQLMYKAKEILRAFVFENRSKNIQSLCLN